MSIQHINGIVPATIFQDRFYCGSRGVVHNYSVSLLPMPFECRYDYMTSFGHGNTGRMACVTSEQESECQRVVPPRSEP